MGLHNKYTERKITKSYSGYVALLCDIIDKEPSNYEEVAEWKEWKDSMIEEYKSIMKNDVCSCCPKTRREVYCDNQVDLQDQACYTWKHREI